MYLKPVLPAEEKDNSSSQWRRSQLYLKPVLPAEEKDNSSSRKRKGNPEHLSAALDRTTRRILKSARRKNKKQGLKKLSDELIML